MATLINALPIEPIIKLGDGVGIKIGTGQRPTVIHIADVTQIFVDRTHASIAHTSRFGTNFAH